MGSDLGLLLSISLSGYALAFAIIGLIVAIPYLLLRREAIPTKAERASREAGASVSEAPVDEELMAAAIAAALYVHSRRVSRKVVVKARSYAPTSSWGIAARLDQLATFERGWGARGWRGSHY